MKKFKVEFGGFKTIVSEVSYRGAGAKALQKFVKKNGYPKRLPYLMQIQEKFSWGWGLKHYWDIREALKLIET